MNIESLHIHLQQFQFRELFVALGWAPAGLSGPQPLTGGIEEAPYRLQKLAGMGRTLVFEVIWVEGSGAIPSRERRERFSAQLISRFPISLLIFLDRERTQSVWHCAQPHGDRLSHIERAYFKGQPGTVFLDQLVGLFHALVGAASPTDTAVSLFVDQLRGAFDHSAVTKTFLASYRQLYQQLLHQIEGIEDEDDLRRYASLALNRLLLAYFLQQQGFFGKDSCYLEDQLERSQRRAKDRYGSDFLPALYFEGLSTPKHKRTAGAVELLGDVSYLGGGIFRRHPVEHRYHGANQSFKPRLPDSAFREAFALFQQFSWYLGSAASSQQRTITPDVLGALVEGSVIQKPSGTYYTPREITDYLCRKTIEPVILQMVQLCTWTSYESLDDLLLRMDARACRALLFEVLPGLTVLDPACGSAAFLLSALKTLFAVYTAAISRIASLADSELDEWMERFRRDAHGHLLYALKRKIVRENLFGVDILDEAVEAARLRLQLSVAAEAASCDGLPPLPDLTFNVCAGNALIGLMPDREELLSDSSPRYREVAARRQELVDLHQEVTERAEASPSLQTALQAAHREALECLNASLLEEFERIPYECATWDATSGQMGRSVKRPAVLEDVLALQPFHWGYEFGQVLRQRGGFDVVLGNPPWQVLKPDAREFAAEHADLAARHSMSTEAFVRDRNTWLNGYEDIRTAWLRYQERFPFQNRYFRSAPQYLHQVAEVGGKRVGTDINLYKLFFEQGYNLLRPGGYCGLVLPSGIYSDLGTKGLRLLLFEQRNISIIGFDNRHNIFEGVNQRFKFCLLTFERKTAWGKIGLLSEEGTVIGEIEI